MAQAGTLFYGEEAVAFYAMVLAAFMSPPAYLRSAARRSEDFWHRTGATRPMAGTPMMHLLTAVQLRVKAQDGGLQHHVVSAGDPGEIHWRPETAECDPNSLHPCLSRCGRCACVHV